MTTAIHQCNKSNVEALEESSATVRSVAGPAGHDSRDRFLELDALRGLAALTVVLNHFRWLWNLDSPPPWLRFLLWRTPLGILFDGHEAVILFFMLSGFVLSLPFLRGTEQPYNAFIVKRFFRIYIPYLAGLALAVLGNAYFYGLAGISDWFSLTWSAPINLHGVLQHILLIGNYDFSQFNPAFWSLVYEMRISIIFPILCRFVLKLNWRAALLVVSLCPLVAETLADLGMERQTSDTFEWIGVFVTGILMARYRRELDRMICSLSNVGRIFLGIISVICYTGGHLFSKPFPSVGDNVIALGAAGFIGLSHTDRHVRSFLHGLLPQFVGRISYSVYLLHGTVLFLLIYVFHGMISRIWLIIPYVLLTLLGAALLYRFVEVPAMVLGRKIARRLT